MQTIKRLLVLLLIAALTVTQLPVTALATGTAESEPDNDTFGESSEIIAFDTLPEETANQAVTLGTSLEDLNLPNILIATVRVAVEDTEAPEPGLDNETVRDSGKPQQEPSDPAADAGNEGEGQPVVDGEQSEHEPEQAPAAPETKEMDISVPVEWVASPEYDSEQADTYTFTAQVEGFTVSAVPPSITVMVGEITDIVTAFEELPDEIRWQNSAKPTFPETVGGTVEGQAVQIPVTWETEQDYDENPPERGLYVFDAVPGDGYTIADGAIAPRITVYIPETVSRFALFRMGGDGTDASPLEITTAAQLAEIAVLVNAGRLESFLLNDANATASLKLMNGLDLSAYGQDYNGGKGWAPIGTLANPFKGSFDGGGNTIAGLYINDANLSNVGLFGSVEDGIIQKLFIEGADITGNNNVGGVAGQIENATIEHCGVDALLHGTATPFDGPTNVGGVVGAVLGSASVKNCYSSGGVTGEGNQVGGITGDLVYNNSIAQNCYSTAMVKGSSFVGGITGGNAGANSVKDCAALNPSISSSYGDKGRVTGDIGWGSISNNVAFSGMAGGGTEIGLDKMDGEDIAATAIKANGTIGGRFTEDSGWTVANGFLPGFGAAVDMPEYITGGSDPNFPGEGTEESPFLIGTAEKLALLAELVNTTTINAQYGGEHIYYKLIGDLDLSGYGASNTGFNSGKGWVPIGSTDTLPFKGIFDGGGNTITGLYLSDPALSYAGLFGYVSGGTVENLALQAVNINSGSINVAFAAAGGVAACVADSGSVQKCSVSGRINSYWHVGGVVGKALDNSTAVKHCLASVSVSGYQYSGGVVGYAEYATIQSCYSTGEISNGIYPNVSPYAGGIAAVNFRGTIKDCAALNPKISAQSYAGRIEGWYDEGTVLTDNVAFDWILDKINNQLSANNYSTGIDGAARTADALQSASGFSSAFTTAPWTYTPGALPGLFGKTAEMPAHITNKLTSFFGGGDGASAETAYQISTPAQLAKLAELVNDGNTEYNSKYYQLTADIDLSGYGASNSDFNGGKGWKPIGTKTNKFQGHFDGNHKSITGLNIHNESADYYANGGCGLFGTIDGGAVQNLLLLDVYVYGYSEVGGVAGKIRNATVQACGVSGSIRGTASGAADVGGVVGSIDANGKVENCYSTGSVGGNSGSANIGGIAGSLTSATSSVQYCYSAAEVNRGSRVGGIAGATWSNNSVIKNCAALNPAISEGTINGRVVGRDNVPSPGKLAGNHAFSGMAGGGSYKTADGTDGADISVSQIFDASFWTIADNWEGAKWSGAIWDFQNDKLPILADFAPDTQSGDGGLYLTERNIANATVNEGGTYYYTGSAIEPTLTVSFDGETLVEDRDYTVSITSTDDSGTSAGTNAGTVTLTLTGKGNFKGAKTGVTYTIQPKALTADMLADVTGTFTYTGLAHTPDVTAKDGTTTLVKDKDYTVTYAGNTNAGTATVTVTGKGNYISAVSKEFIITKAPLAITGGTAETKIYDGTASAALSAVTFDGLQGGESLTLNTDYTVTGAQFDSADAGSDKTLSATVALVSNGSMSRNYSLASGNLSLTGRIISKATTTGVPQTVEAVKGYAKNHDFDLTTLLPDVTGALGTVAYTPVITQNDDGVLNTISYTSGSTLPLPVQAVADSGKTAVVTVTIKSDNYNDFTATITVETVEKTPVSISGISMTGGVYNGTPYSYTGTPAFNHSVSGLPVSITAYDVLYTSTDGGGYSGTNAPANAGDYKLMISVSDSDLLYTGSESFGFTIEQRPITVKADDKSMSRGGTLPVFTYKVDGQLSGESALVGIPALASTGDGKAAGSYPITVDLAGVSYHSNYKAATPASVSGTLKVNNSSSGSSSGSGGGSSSGSTQSQSFSTATNNTGIGIDTSGFNLPDGITLVSPHIYGLPTSTTGRAWTLLLTRAPASVGRGGVLGGRSYLALYEFKLLDENGKPVHNIGWTTIRLPIPEGANPDSLMVLYYDEKTRSFTNMGAQVENGYLVFRTPHFSYYMVTGVSENVPAIPETGGGMGVQERLRLLPAAFEKIRHTQRSPLLALSPRRH